jgi:hypothetical protein
MAWPWPGGQDEQQPSIGARADLVALGGVEHGQQARPAGDGLVPLDHVDLAFDDDQVGALVDLMVLERFARGEVQDDRARLAPRGVQDQRLVRLDGKAAQVPVLHTGSVLPG